MCEVEDFGEGDLDRHIAEIPIGEARGGAFESKNRFLAMVVLHNPGFFVHLNEVIVAGAMYGNL